VEEFKKVFTVEDTYCLNTPERYKAYHFICKCGLKLNDKALVESSFTELVKWAKKPSSSIESNVTYFESVQDCIENIVKAKSIEKQTISAELKH
jgi:hypothetical protein